MVEEGSVAAWEGVALSVHRATGIDAPVSAFVLARACGLRVVGGTRGRAFLDGDTIHFDASARTVRQHGSVGHEVSHYVLRLHGEEDSEPAARYTTGALLLPRATFDKDLRETEWDLFGLQRRHPNASFELIARRIPELRDAVVSICDGRRAKRICSPDFLLGPQLLDLTWREKMLRDEALTSGKPQRIGMLAAYPLIDGPHRRVIIVAEAREIQAP